MSGNRYVALPTSVLQRRDLSAGAKLLYARLRDLAAIDGNGIAWPSLQRLCDDLGTFRSDIVRWLDRLTTAGLIRVVKRGKGSRATCYAVEDPAVAKRDHDGGETSGRKTRPQGKPLAVAECDHNGREPSSRKTRPQSKSIAVAKQDHVAVARRDRSYKKDTSMTAL